MNAMEEGRIKHTFMDSFWAELKETEVPVHQNSRNATTTLSRVPDWLRSFNARLYEPSLVYIGPYHWTRLPHEDVKLMLRQKRQCVALLFKERSELDKCVKELQDLEDFTRSSYIAEDGIKNMPSDEFVKMMLLDSCFIIVVLICFAKFKSSPVTDDFQKTGIFKMRFELMEDLCLIENQVPSVLLRTVYNFCCAEYKEHLDSNDMINDIYKQLLKPEKGEFRNLLHILYKNFVKENSSGQARDWHWRGVLFCGDWVFDCLAKLIARKRNRSVKEHYPAQSATKLQERGVKFERTDDDIVFRKIRFTKYGKLKIPWIDLDSSELANVLAFEQTNFCKNQVRLESDGEEEEDDGDFVIRKTPWSNTMHFVASMITNPRDLETLEEWGVIDRGGRSTDEDTVRFFGQLRSKLQLSEDYDYEQNLLWKEIDVFIRARRNEWWVKLKKDYFGNPWTMLSLFAAIILLIMTFLQTYYTVYSFYQN